MMPLESFSYDKDDIRDMLIDKIQVFYVRSAETNRERERDKDKTINWILERLWEGPHPGGTRVELPECTYTFGELWEPISTAVRMKHPFCQICGMVPVQEVHHIRPRFLRGTNDPCNLLGLCFKCHDEVHRRVDSGITQAIIDSTDFKPEPPAESLDSFVQDKEDVES